MCAVRDFLQRLGVEREVAIARRSCAWLKGSVECSAAVTLRMQREWRELQRRTKLIHAMLDDAQAACTGYQQRCVRYRCLQERQLSFNGGTVPTPQVEVRTWWSALHVLEGTEGQEGAGEELSLSSVPPPLSYGSVAAALHRHQQRWREEEEKLQRAHHRIQQQHADMSDDTSTAPIRFTCCM